MGISEILGIDSSRDPPESIPRIYLIPNRIRPELIGTESLEFRRIVGESYILLILEGVLSRITENLVRIPPESPPESIQNRSRIPRIPRIAKLRFTTGLEDNNATGR